MFPYYTKYLNNISIVNYEHFGVASRSIIKTFWMLMWTYIFFPHFWTNGQCSHLNTSFVGTYADHVLFCAQDISSLYWGLWSLQQLFLPFMLRDASSLANACQTCILFVTPLLVSSYPFLKSLCWLMTCDQIQ